MLLRVYTSVPSGKEFRVLRDDDGKFVCNCKEYRDGMAQVLGSNARTCRHIRDYKKLAATWSPNPFDTTDWL